MEPEPAPFHLTEREDVQLAAVDLLARMGYHILTREEALKLRGGKPNTPLLVDILRAQLPRLNKIQYKGQRHDFSPQNIRRAIQALDEVPRAHGLQHASEQVYDLVRLGKSFEQTIAGDTRSFTLQYIDWKHPENNVFHATTELTLYRSESQQTARLDVVCFVNGIPFVAMECKAAHTELSEGVDDLIAYQRDDQIPEFFKFAQVLIATNRREARYATVGAGKDFWAHWESRPEEKEDEALVALLSQPLPHDEREALLANFVRERPHYYALHEATRERTAQDRLLYSLCRPERLLELVERFVLYDGGIKKIARYQQYYAVLSTMKRLKGHLGAGRRTGGVIWHTQGSGKSLTMVFLANAIALAPEIEQPRIVLVTDRVDLDKQLKSTFERCGLSPKRATSGAELRRLVENTNATVITTLVQKFDAALESGLLANDSANIFILVDESHRTQYGTLATKMRLVFPNACYLGFTGTPLMQRDKSTVAQFGGLIDVYSIDRAVRDKAVVPLLYEARHIEQEVQQNSIDTWFERLCQGLTPNQQEDLKRKYSRSDRLSQTEQRLRMIAFDVSEHYRAHWQNDGYYKGQLVAPNKKSAVRLHRYLSEIGHVKSCVVISPPDEREGDEEPDDESDASVTKFWRETVGTYASPERYEESVLSNFSSSEPPEILIVVNKLLTGFDVPRNTVLYLARRLKHHDLLQAVARVNRLYPGKDFGYIVDYVGILGELDQALTAYRELEGYDEKDLIGLLAPVQEQYRDLPLRHAELLDVFKSIQNKNDTEEYELLLADDAQRTEFYDRLTAFSKCLKIALSTERFYEETAAYLIERYRTDLQRFQKLRASVQLRYADTVNMKRLEPQISKLLDTYVSSDAVAILTPEPVNIFDTKAMNAALATLDSPAARADTIAHAMERTLTERLDQDPALYRKFSELLQETIAAFHQHMLSGVEYLQQVLALRDQVLTGKTKDTLPERLQGNDMAAALYRIVQERGQALGLPMSNPEATVTLALGMEQAIQRAVVVDWAQKPDVLNQMRTNLDDVFYELSQQSLLHLDWPLLDELATEVLRIARSRFA